MLRQICFAIIAPALLLSCAANQSVAQSAESPSSSGVAAGHDPRIGPIGEQIMRDGGSATDAAIAMMLALAVVEPQSSGLGGGGFLIRGDATGFVETIDGRETAPSAAMGEWFLNADGSVRSRREAVLSGLSIGVPGAIALAAEAHDRHGRLPWAELFQPAINLARNGFPITPRLSGSLASFPERAGRDPTGLAMFYEAGGEAPAPGALVHLPALADTLEMIAQEGPDSFYSGPFAEELASTIGNDTPRAERMQLADIENYRALVREPACVLYRLHRICTMGPPSSGGVAMLMILKQLERFDLAEMGLQNPATWHAFIEAQRLAYADRSHYVADADFVDVPLSGLLDTDYLASRAALINLDGTLPSATPGNPPGAAIAMAQPQSWIEQGTTFFVAVHEDGTMVSFNATVEGAFGSGLVHGGFYLNNELTDFSYVPSDETGPVANRVQGGKRPASSMSPAIVYDPSGEPLFAVGAAGGALIPTQTARAIIAVVDFDLALEEALGLPFVMAVGEDTILVEANTWMADLGDDFVALGHERAVPFDRLLRTTGALRTEGGWQARFDPRLDDLVRIPPAPQERAADEAGFSEGLTQGSADLQSEESQSTP